MLPLHYGLSEQHDQPISLPITRRAAANSRRATGRAAEVMAAHCMNVNVSAFVLRCDDDDDGRTTDWQAVWTPQSARRIRPWWLVTDKVVGA